MAVNPAEAGTDAISQPCPQAIELIQRIKAETDSPVVAEVGIGIGATSLEICRVLDHSGYAWFFDFEDRLELLGSKLTAAGFNNFRTVANSRRTFDSYSWTLATMVRRRRAQREGPLFDFIYLDGAHAFHHDAPATFCVKELLKVGGYLLMDDYDWTIAVSPTMRPSVNPGVVKHYSDEQIELSHVEMVCSLLLDTDPNFEAVPIGYARREHRRAYRKVG